MNVQAVFSVSLILFSVIDVIGSLPVIIDMKNRGVQIHAATATMVAGLLMLVFLFFGASVLKAFGVEVSSFALAGSLIIFFIGLEMVLGIRFFREEQEGQSSGTIVPIAFPILAGAGTMTTIVSLKAKYGTFEIMSGIILNLLIIFLTLHAAPWIAKKLGPQAMETLRKGFGVLIIAIAFQMFKTNWIA